MSRKKLLEAAGEHAEVAEPLESWFRIVRHARWNNFADLRRTWGNADIFGSCTIFNIKGNKYRLITWIDYRTQKLFIRQVLTHAEYDRGGWKSDCTGG